MKNSTDIQQAFHERLDEGELMNCMRCGFCLPACPTYIHTGGNELHSPRGRIAMMKAVHDGEMAPTEEMKASLDLCLGCRACEPACPAGVTYGHLLEESRAIFAEHEEKSPVHKLVFGDLFPKPKRMKQAIGAVRLYQKSGLQKVTRTIGFLSLFPKGMKELEETLPEVIPKKERVHRAVYHAVGEKKATVAFFTGCLMDTLFHPTNKATIGLLQLAGCEVVVPAEQACCGALHGHAGEKAKGIEMAKHNITAFEASEADHIVLNAGGCGAFLQEYDTLLVKEEGDWPERAKRFAQKIQDFSSVLFTLGFIESIPLKLEEKTITFQDSCHLRNGQHVFKEPRALLQAIQGTHYVEMANADSCCGSAGVYNMLQPEMAGEILKEKMNKVNDTQADVIVTANPGCLLQMKAGCNQHSDTLTTEAMHLADLLWESVGQEQRQNVMN
ncbi:(Fe-S)-binding protein [Aureibacillus halotolerans]|uniref:Glycolate oxidase iron-sulfur subunit n=1 Tax=Aureibacillus halotolerans TaxID=1508390 RepID=A0A4R6U8T0_9BACI|nr:(Fe-S)-binding protein [Aureibacillus halotolerans]TDQ42978.1 glycolate oxidase iron-sulfur subunit [Aureibacillus halotolerans]